MLSMRRLKAAQSAVNASAAYRALGSVDAKVAMVSGKSAFLATFRAFGCANIERIDEADIRDGDFAIAMAPREWRDYLAQRASGEGQMLVELDLEQGIVKAANPRGKQVFFRYHQSLQQFVDALVDIEPTSRRSGRAAY